MWFTFKPIPNEIFQILKQRQFQFEKEYQMPTMTNSNFIQVDKQDSLISQAFYTSQGDI